MRGPEPNSSAAERGSTVVGYVAGVAVLLVFFILLLQFLFWQYGRGAVRSALDEGARAGAATTNPDECQRRAQASLQQLLGGDMGAHTTITCAQTPQTMTANASVTFPAWLTFVPDWTFQLEAAAAIETIEP